MSKKIFTEDELRLLRENKYTYSVTPTSLHLTKEFKKIFLDEFEKGKTAREILEEHGYPYDVLGKNRVNAMSCSIRNQAQSPMGLREGNRPLPSSSDENISAAEVRRLQERVSYLEQQVEFLKKISSIRNTGK